MKKEVAGGVACKNVGSQYFIPRPTLRIAKDQRCLLFICCTTISASRLTYKIETHAIRGRTVICPRHKKT